MMGSNEKIRVASVQWQAGKLTDKAQFFDRIEYWVRAASDYGSDFVVFPELFTLCLLSPETPMEPKEVSARSHEHTDEFVDRMTSLAQSCRINIVGGSHLRIDADGVARNTSYVALRDGSMHARDKLHPTPTEDSAWNVVGGDNADVVQTDCGLVGVMICYDSEFPEMSRRLIDQGARVLFVPYCTDTSHGHLRVRYCCHARTVENQCYVVTSGITGDFHNLPQQFCNFARSAVLTPSDLPFARDGIAAEASENAEMIIYADLDLAALDWARQEGSVRNLGDRRHDLYSVEWKR
ncbi:MAG: carbon-nitrogen hydrolase family protein [Hyphomicrobiales bacterium]|nr:carbon-nitrogen hydrolase family protein [Hyphomicrobiales bacterium]MCP5000686.1 carbon-nitrogen hydrolase family protein [Hyphomicrobiales bacterium]